MEDVLFQRYFNIAFSNIKKGNSRTFTLKGNPYWMDLEGIMQS